MACPPVTAHSSHLLSLPPDDVARGVGWCGGVRGFGVVGVVGVVKVVKVGTFLGLKRLRGILRGILIPVQWSRHLVLRSCARVRRRGLLDRGV